jgi:hypothetical protein
MKRIALLVLGICLFVSQAAFAWGNRGHELIAHVAQRRLSTTVERRALDLLRSSNRCPATPSRRNLAQVATLPDEFRNREGGQITRSWHFVNIDVAHPDYSEARDCPLGDCVIRRIERATEMLRDEHDQFTDCERKDALIYLIHFVGDLHQPFHCGFGRFANSTADRGGNSVRVRIGNQSTNLHSAWDGTLIELQNRTDDQWAGHLIDEVIPSLDPQLAAETSVAAWADESHDIARTEHPRPANEDDVTTLDDDYLQKNSTVVEQRLALAAVRLANLITAALR